MRDRSRSSPRNCKPVLVHFLLALICGRGLAQENAKPLSPSEAYKAALAPFQASRTQPDDLTDADRFALEIGIASASRDVIVEGLTIDDDQRLVAGVKGGGSSDLKNDSLARDAAGC